jgi:hypothetical protein
MIEQFINTSEGDTGREILQGIKEAVDGITSTLDRNSTHIQLAFNQYKSTMERLSSISTSLSYREQCESACKATKTIMDDCEARLLQAGNMYSLLLSEKDRVLDQARLQCQAMKVQADFSYGAKLAVEEQLRNLQETVERESYLKDLAVKESLELRARLNENTKPEIQAVKPVSEESSTVTTFCSESETGTASASATTQTETFSSEADNAVLRKKFADMEAKITTLTTQTKKMATERAAAEARLSASNTQIKVLRAQVKAEVSHNHESRVAVPSGSMTPSNIANDPLLAVVSPSP